MLLSNNKNDIIEYISKAEKLSRNNKSIKPLYNIEDCVIRTINVQKLTWLFSYYVFFCFSNRNLKQTNKWTYPWENKAYWYTDGIYVFVISMLCYLLSPIYEITWSVFHQNPSIELVCLHQSISQIDRKLYFGRTLRRSRQVKSRFQMNAIANWKSGLSKYCLRTPLKLFRFYSQWISIDVSRDKAID